MKYRIVSDGHTFRPMYKKNWYSRWQYFDDYARLEAIREFDTLKEAEMFITQVVADIIYLTRKWKTVKTVKVTDLEIAVYEKKP